MDILSSKQQLSLLFISVSGVGPGVSPVFGDVRETHRPSHRVSLQELSQPCVVPRRWRRGGQVSGRAAVLAHGPGAVGGTTTRHGIRHTTRRCVPPVVRPAHHHTDGRSTRACIQSSRVTMLPANFNQLLKNSQREKSVFQKLEK